MIVTNTLLKDEKNGTDLISTLSDVQLGASTMARRLSAMSGNLAYYLDRDLDKCSWFSIQCDDSVDNSKIAQLLVFIRMAFEDSYTKEELLTLLPLNPILLNLFRAIDSSTAGLRSPPNQQFITPKLLKLSL